MPYTFYFLVRSYLAFSYFDRCIDSIFSQKKINFTIIFVDDASGYTKKQKNYISKKLADHICIFNDTRKFSLQNAYDLIHTYVAEKNAVVISLDGDGWLYDDKVLLTLQQEYTRTNPSCTYGNCQHFNPGGSDHGLLSSEIKELNAAEYPDYVVEHKAFRKYHFQITHLKTWKAEAFKKIPLGYFHRPDGSWLQFCEDQAIFFALLELADGNYSVFAQPLCVYNTANPLQDVKVNVKQLFLDELYIRRMKPLTF